jgi:Protein of unknown function (DUF4235)
MAKQSSGGMGLKLLTVGGTIGAAWVARKGVSTGWKAVTGNEPPVNPEDPDVDWAEAVGWALLSGAVIGMARLAASRQAAVVYRKVTGVQPTDASAAAS